MADLSRAASLCKEYAGHFAFAFSLNFSLNAVNVSTDDEIEAQRA